MRAERLTIPAALLFAGCILIFILAGEVWGWRAVGVVALFGAVGAWRERRVGVGIDGHEPSFFLTGRAAVAAAFLGVLVALFFIFFAHIVANVGK